QDKLYPQELYGFWTAPMHRQLMIFSVVVIAWVHGCIGLHFWLRMKAFYRRAAPYLLAAAVLIPTLALLGVYQGGRGGMADSTSPEGREQTLSAHQMGTPAEQATLGRIVDDFLAGYLGLIAVIVLARGARVLLERRGGMIRLSYGNGRTVRVPKGLS